VTITSPLESKARRARRGRVLARWLVRLAVLALVFGIGVAVGQALEDPPESGKPVTNISTFQPWTQTTP
jgi:hypothetical protein